jgi:acylaminoacyl-peptidase
MSAPTAAAAVCGGAGYAAVTSLARTLTWGRLLDQRSVTLRRSVRDLEADRQRSHLQTLRCDWGKLEEPSWSSAGFPMELQEGVAFSASPSGKRSAFIRPPSDGLKPGKAESHTIEVWDRDSGALSARIQTGKAHGAVLEGGWFGGVSWSPDENVIVYVAQPGVPTSKSHFELEEEGESQDSAPGHQHVYREDWGETFVGVQELGLFVAHLDTGRVSRLPGVDGAITPGQPQIVNDGRGVVYTGWENSPRKLGMIHCCQRPCKLYAAPIPLGDSEEVGHICLTPNDRLAQCPRVAPSGKQLVYLSRSEGFDTHSGSFRLNAADLRWDQSGQLCSLTSARTLVNTVDSPSYPGDFPGLWLTRLPDRCWSPDEKSVYVTSMWGSASAVVRVSLDGTVSRVKAATRACADGSEEASTGVLDVGSFGLLVTSSSPNTPDGFAILSHDSESEVLVGPRLGPAVISSGALVSADHLNVASRSVEAIKWRIMHVFPPAAAAGAEGAPPAPFECIVMMPPEGARVPLVVVPHGGPHSCVPTIFVPSYAYLCADRGYAVMHVNYRGSTGFGEAALNSLPGRIGSQDVQDVLQATQQLLQEEAATLDASRVAIAGGSHGGFLSCHMTAQYPNVYKVAVMRNPVTNIVSMTTATDIPDWCWVEAVGIGSYDFSRCGPADASAMEKMWEASPARLISQVKAPTLLGLGLKDRRVPASQGFEWFHILRSANVPSKLLAYKEDTHAIDRPASEADFWVNAADWLEKYL